MNGAEYAFVGCGGTFWCGTPYLSNLMRRYKPPGISLVDPDDLKPKNFDRQWSNYDQRSGSPKIVAAREAMGMGYFEDPNDPFVPLRFEDWAYKDQIEGPLVVVVNVDSNRSRLAIRGWCMDRGARGLLTAMVVSGCDGGGGQAYWGVWGTPPHLRDHDWLVFHGDVETEPDLVVRPEHGCGGQTTFANALTGQLLGLAIENMTQYVEVPGSDINEYWWERNLAGRFRSWSLLVKPTGPMKGVVTA